MHTRCTYGYHFNEPVSAEHQSWLSSLSLSQFLSLSSVKETLRTIHINWSWQNIGSGWTVKKLSVWSIKSLIPMPTGCFCVHTCMYVCILYIMYNYTSFRFVQVKVVHTNQVGVLSPRYTLLQTLSLSGYCINTQYRCRGIGYVASIRHPPSLSLSLSFPFSLHDTHLPFFPLLSVPESPRWVRL